MRVITVVPGRVREARVKASLPSRPGERMYVRVVRGGRVEAVALLVRERDLLGWEGWAFRGKWLPGRRLPRWAAEAFSLGAWPGAPAES